MPKPMNAPRYLYISRWAGALEDGLRMKHSLPNPKLLLLLGDLISRGSRPLSSSSTMFTSESRKGPPASMEPSPRNLIL